MKPIALMQEERLFPPFLDTVDGTLCLPASATAAEIHARIAEHSLRFPLLLDTAASLQAQVNATTHAPASCRFGPYCDNLLGMNWRLPSGRIVRIGERVVKTTTGYDWLRFLLHSGPRFGTPLDYVLRLRPDCGFHLSARFSGAPHALHGCVRRLLHSGWMHWWDAVDFITEGATATVRVVVHCPQKEASLFETELLRIAADSHAQLQLEQSAPPPWDGLPDLVIKTTPDRALLLAEKLAPQSVRCIALCYSGVVHVSLGGNASAGERARLLIEPYLAELHALGGDWHSRWLPSPPATPAEARWIETLEQSIHAS